MASQLQGNINGTCRHAHTIQRYKGPKSPCAERQIHGCCPKFLVPEMAQLHEKQIYFRETFVEPSPCMILTTSSVSKRKGRRERER